jgi:glycosyltransferase involved in cell wall biosynthesis
MKILICSRVPLSRELGASKVLVELAEAMRAQDCTCDMIDSSSLGLTSLQTLAQRQEFSKRLRERLIATAGEYDVVDYDHEDLPFDRREFSPTTLMVARSVLLVHHLEMVRIPSPPFSLRSLIGTITKGRARAALRRWRIQSATTTVQQADLVNVSNADDLKALVKIGISADKIIVLPFGLSDTRRRQFDRLQKVTGPPRVAFVGTFDYRKGALDFPKIVAEVAVKIPNVKFRLLGTSGLFRTEQQVRAHFPERLQDRLEIIPTFPAGELPNQLADCTVGMFPSYLEGFGFGVLEMLAAGLPVIAYHAPGPPEMLPPKWLVEPGDTTSMSGCIIELLRDPHLLQGAQVEARESSRRFSWENIARETIRCYSSFRRQLPTQLNDASTHAREKMETHIE